MGAHATILRTGGLALALAVAHAAACAGAGTLVTTVAPLTPLSAAVTYSSPGLNTYVGYTVTITNAGGNTINNIVFTGSTAVTDGTERAVFSTADGVVCSQPSTVPVTTLSPAADISCAVGQLKAGKSFPTFAVFFKAPVKDTAAQTTLPDGRPPDPQDPNADPHRCLAGTDCVSFAGTTYYAEVTGGLPNSLNSLASWTTDQVRLGTASATLVKSAVQKTGGVLFTGSGATPTSVDPFATLVNVPAGPTYTTATIQETPDQDTADLANCSNFTTCYQSAITIPVPGGETAFRPYLTIVLRQDASTIRKGTKIGSVLIQYTAGAGALPAFVGDCASGPTPRNDGIPCISGRTAYTNSKVPGWSPDLDGDFEWTLINLKNGSYKVF